MSQRQDGQSSGGGILSSRRGLIRAATGAAATGLVVGAMLESGTAAAQAPPTGAGGQFYVAIEGARQGKLKGEASGPRGGGWIEGLGFHYEVSSPRDPATGLASGKRQHRAIRMTKLWGAASPQLFQALVTNETLTRVRFEFVRTDATGSEVVFYTVTLSDASIVNIEQYMRFNATGHQNADDPRELEDVSFVFRKIEVEHKEGKTVASDDWLASRI